MQSKITTLESIQVQDFEELKELIKNVGNKIHKVDVWKGDHESQIKRLHRQIDRIKENEKAKIQKAKE